MKADAHKKIRVDWKKRRGAKTYVLYNPQSNELIDLKLNPCGCHPLDAYMTNEHYFHTRYKACSLSFKSRAGLTRWLKSYKFLGEL